MSITIKKNIAIANKFAFGISKFEVLNVIFEWIKYIIIFPKKHIIYVYTHRQLHMVFLFILELFLTMSCMHVVHKLTKHLKFIVKTDVQTMIMRFPL